MYISEIFVVFDPTQETQPALERSITAALEIGATLRVFSCIYNGVSKRDDEVEQIKQFVAAQKQCLESVVEPIRQQGIAVVTEVEWDENWYKAVVRASVRHGSDVVFKSTYKHSVGKRILNKTSDWTLIRECLCPVFLVREGASWDSRKVLAAVDVRAEKEGYVKLNKSIINFSKNVLGQNDAEMHYINAYNDSMAFPDRGELVKICGVESKNIHIDMGSPEEVIVERAKALDASLVVIGSSKRTGVSAFVHGNTVEKVLDDLECDLLSIP